MLGMALSNAAFVFAKSDVQDPVDRTFDALMSARCSQELLGIGGQAGDEISRFTGGMVRQPSFAFNHDQTLELRPFFIGVHVIEEFRGGGGPAATDFGYDATAFFFRDNYMLL